MKKFVIYLLTLMMAFSPAAVFADVEVQADPADAVEAELTEDAADAAVVPDPEVPEEEQLTEEVQDEEADLAPAEAESVQDEAAADVTPTDEESDTYTWVVDSDGKRDFHHAEKDGVRAKGVFKAKRFRNGTAVGTSLFYANDNEEVEFKEQLVTGSGYIHDKDSEGEAWIPDGGTHKYLVTKHDEFDNAYFVYCQNDVKTVNGKMYYVQTDATVKTDAGVINYKGDKYYVQDGGEIKTTAGWVQDADGTWYFLPTESASSGKLRTAEGLFQAGGKTWYSANGGAVRTTGGVFTYGASQYYSYDDGSVNTAEGFVYSGGKKYLCASGGAIRKTAGVVPFAGSMYVALSDGSICTTPGFVNAGSGRYYVSDSSGALAVNKAFKSGSSLYHALADGTIGVGVHKWGKYYYYGDGNGVIRTKKGVVSWAGKKYYVKKGGKITTNKKVKYKGKTYIAGSDGAFAKGIFTWKKNLYYADKKGKLRTKAGVFTYNGSRYASKKGGKLYRNKLFTLKGKKYLAQSDGKLKAGSFTWKGKMYLTDSKCAVITKAGLYTYGGHQYYVKKGGPLAVNEFVTYKDNHYYAGGDGAIVKKKFTYKGVTITPNSSTGVISLEEYWKVFPNEAPQESAN